MDADKLFNPSLAAALMKLDPEDGEKMVEYFKTHALLSREKALLQASVREQKKLLVENSRLKKDIEQLRAQLQEKQRRRSAKALQNLQPSSSASPTEGSASPTEGSASPAEGSAPSRERGNGRRRGERGARRAAPPPQEALPAVDVSRLDLRVGRIVSARRHPLCEALWVQQVDVGEGGPRTVVTRLRGRSQPDQLAVLLCNVKPSKARGVASQARLLCCCGADDIVELLAPPPDSAPGDRVTCPDFPGDPDPELASKQRLWERLQPRLMVDGGGEATYEGRRLQVEGKGPCRAPTLTRCSIR